MKAFFLTEEVYVQLESKLEALERAMTVFFDQGKAQSWHLKFHQNEELLSKAHGNWFLCFALRVLFPSFAFTRNISNAETGGQSLI